MTRITAFSTRQAARLAGLKTAHMADYLARTAVVKPSVRSAPGRGNKRLYSFQDVLLLRALNRLLRQGISVHRLKKVQRTYARLFGKESPFTLAERYLMTDGKRVFFTTDPSKVVDLTSDGQMAFGFVIDLKPIVDEVNAELAKMAS